VDGVNVGCAVSIQLEERRNALVVPVVHDADRLSREIAARRKDLTDAPGRDGSASTTRRAEPSRSPTLARSGPRGISRPIINQPEAAILGTASIVDRPVVVDGAIVARPIMPVTVTFDHRIMDGAPPAEFLGHVHEMLTDPHMMLV
jgi:pyruvate/2-oxoglutarate dehydrogenase complex dihydrolipoamide acyltransferase (E2) component